MSGRWHRKAELRAAKRRAADVLQMALDEGLVEVVGLDEHGEALYSTTEKGRAWVESRRLDGAL